MQSAIDHTFYMTGIVTWCLLALFGLFWIADKIAEWFIDSARFKAYVWSYLRNSRPDRAAKIDEAVRNYPKKS